MTTEARIGRAKAPRCYRLHHLRRWRWDVVRYRAVEGEHPGVLDSRVHLSADHGYTFTRIGAAWAMAGAVLAAEHAEPRTAAGHPAQLRPGDSQ